MYSTYMLQLYFSLLRNPWLTLYTLKVLLHCALCGLSPWDVIIVLACVPVMKRVSSSRTAFLEFPSFSAIVRSILQFSYNVPWCNSLHFLFVWDHYACWMCWCIVLPNLNTSGHYLITSGFLAPHPRLPFHSVCLPHISLGLYYPEMKMMILSSWEHGIW